MLTMLYKTIAASKPFRFLVGPDKKEYMMHADLVANMSRTLNALVNGSMKEASEGVVEWPEVDETTFICFCQFAYTRDYRIENPGSEDSVEKDGWSVSPETCESCFHWGLECRCTASTIKSSNKKKGKSLTNFGYSHGTQGNREQLWENFILESGLKTSDLAKKENLSVDWAQTLLVHARVYTLADCYGIDSLAMKSSKSIHCCLAALELDENSIIRIIQLIQYTFENTADRQCRLRAILCLFAASKLDNLWPTPEFQELLLNLGEFSWGIIGYLVNKID